MRIEKITYRSRNDFHWIGLCEHCGHEQKYGDGYADGFYCLQVVPHRHCSKCDLNSYGLTEPQQQAAWAAKEKETQS